MSATLTDTHASLDADSPAGAKFLRRVIRDNASLGWSEGWRAHVTKEPQGWSVVRFSRRVKPAEVGDPETLVEVSVRGIGIYGTGVGHRAPVTHEDHGHTVYVRCPHRLHLDGGELVAFCRAALQGMRFYIWAGPGSPNTSELGLSFYYLSAEDSDRSYSFGIGAQTIATNDRLLTRGPVDVS